MNKRRRASRCGTKSFCCLTCNTRFCSSVNLARHQRIHTGEKPYLCPKCSKSFTHSGSFSNHMRTHSGVRPYQCQQCKKSFFRSYHLECHTRIHTGQKPYKCQQCNKLFTQSSNLVSHQRTHTMDKPYPCLKCSQCFSISRNLSRHMRTHTRERQYQCQQCKKRFSVLSQLVCHQKTHTVEKSYPCLKCSKCFSYSVSLSNHMRIHTGEKPYQCQQCKKRFSYRSHLVCHMRIHTGQKPYQCAHCPMSFPYASSLARHQRIHTEEKTYICQLCNKRFSQSIGLARHVRIHTGRKPHQCVRCDERLSESSYLAVRLRTHSGKNPYGCQFCCKRFLQKFRLEMHLQTHIGKIQDTCHQSSRSLKHSDQLVHGQQSIPGKSYDVSGKIFVRSNACFPLLPKEGISLDDVTKSVEVNESDLTSFQAGYYGTTSVTLGFLPASVSIDFLSSLQSCLHPNIAVFYGMTLMSGSCATLVMENVTTSLSHVLDEIGGQLSLRERLDIAVGCVSAVDYLHHQLGVSHGMLTCDYVFLSNCFSAKVLDPMVASLIDMSHFHTCDAMEDDIRQLGLILLSLFRGIVLTIDPDVCDESGQCCAPHRLHTVLGLMVNGEETDVPSTKAIISALENMRLTDQYRQCHTKCGVSYGNS